MKYLTKSVVLRFNTSFPFRLERHSVSSPFFYWDYYKKLISSNDWGKLVKPLEASFKVCQLLLSEQILLFLFFSVLIFFLWFLLDLLYLTDKTCIRALRTEWITKPHLQPMSILEFGSAEKLSNTWDLWKKSGSHYAHCPYWNNAATFC